MLFLLFIISRGSSIFRAIRTVLHQADEETRIKMYYHQSYLEIMRAKILLSIANSIFVTILICVLLASFVYIIKRAGKVAA